MPAWPIPTPLYATRQDGSSVQRHEQEACGQYAPFGLRDHQRMPVQRARRNRRSRVTSNSLQR